MSDFNSDICNHVIVNHIFVISFDFCHDVVIVACFVIGKTCKGNFSVFVITCLGNDLTLVITKVEGEFTCFQVATMKGFVEDDISCSCFFIFDGVVESDIFRISDVCDKSICFITDFFSDSDLNTSGHGVINDVFIRSFFFSHKVGVSACLCEGEVFKGNMTVFVICCCGKELALFVTKVKGEFTVFKASTVKGFRQVKVDTSVFEFFDLVIKGCVFRINDA